jgi:DNA primase
MDPVADIKARLPIEQLVAQYVQLKPKGRSFIGLCPFHNDKHPSFLVSPDKGIAYCFACNSGGDIFSFYQKIESVDFPQAIRDLAEKTGVQLPERGKAPVIERDEKERLRMCIEAAQKFFLASFHSSPAAQAYIVKRGVPSELIERFGIGYAPDSFSALYQHLLKEGFSRKEIVTAGLGIQKDLSEERIYDRFRNRITFPISDTQGRIIAFGGRTIGDDDAKYINSSESPLYRKASVLFGLHLAREAIRSERRVVMVEGYFDVVACHKAGVTNAVAVSGTALTEEHARTLKRSADSVVLCLDADRAGQQAAERAFGLCSREGLIVHIVRLSAKDPDEVATTDPQALRKLLSERLVPYLDAVLHDMQTNPLTTPELRRSAEDRALHLVAAVPAGVEQDQYRERFGKIFGDSFTRRFHMIQSDPSLLHTGPTATLDPRGGSTSLFSPTEVTLGLFALYPSVRSLLGELIAPDDPFGATLYASIQSAGACAVSVPAEHAERLAVLLMYCEQHGFQDWSASLATREIRRNCQRANRMMILQKQREVTEKLKIAHAEGRLMDAAQLETQFQQILKLTKMAG